MARETADLPLARDAASRFVPWVIAVMVFLAALALAGAMLLATAISGWTAGLSGTITVQVLPNAAGTAATERDLAKTTALLRATPGVARVRVLDEAASRRLLEPWLGRGNIAPEMPVPRLIDVTLEDGARIDTEALKRRLRAAVPSVEVDDHRKWLGRLVGLARSIEMLALLVLGLTALAAVVAVVFAARTGLAIHRRVIEVLHMIGARDLYIARQFQRRALLDGLKGGIAGLAAAIVTLLAIGHVAGDIRLFGLTQVRFEPLHWAALAGLVPAAAVIAMLTARVTVMRTLARLP